VLRSGCIIAVFFLLLAACREKSPGNVSDASGPRCGNGRVDPGEECDTDDFGGKQCSDLGFDRGVLSCTAECQFDTSQCSRCGNGFVELDEQCDDTDLAGRDPSLPT